MSKHSLCVNRLQKELLAIEKNKDIKNVFTARPLPTNILEWHYIIFGPKQTPYEGGVYHGQIIFPLEYPHKPPSILMTTPSGRFTCNSRICVSMSDFHQEEWSPSWSTQTIIMGLLSFMTEESTGFGSITKSEQIRRQYAAASMAFNLKNPVFVKLFPDLVLSNKLVASSSTPIIIDEEEESINNNRESTTSTSTTTTTTTTTTTSTSALNNIKSNNTLNNNNNNNNNKSPILKQNNNNNNNSLKNISNDNNNQRKQKIKKNDNDMLSIILLSMLLIILSAIFYKFM